jgi:hypothetical protein
MLEMINSTEFLSLLPWVLLALGFWAFVISASLRKRTPSDDSQVHTREFRPKSRGL